MVVSLIFYSWGEGRLIAIMMFSSLMDFVAGLGMSHGWRGTVHQLVPGTRRTSSQRAWLIVSLAINIGILGFFKYFHFGLDNINTALTAIGLSAQTWHPVFSVVLPLGISFYTFQSMSYTIDVYRGHVPATRNIVDYITFVTMFPQLVAGPIVRYADVMRELHQRVVMKSQFVDGIRRFSVGMAKKMLLANTVAVAADELFGARPETLTRAEAWFGLACYALQIYFDFAGYSDMAIGMGKMLGFTFLENFNYPYIATSLKDFWRRWHMSMSTWFRDYLYVPLGGNRRGRTRTYLNLLVVFFVTGLWHGASWTFVAWGLWHGVFLMIERLGFDRLLKKLWLPFQHLYTLLAVLGGWILFRSDSFAHAAGFVRALVFGGNGAFGSDAIRNPQILLAMVIGLCAATPVLISLRDRYISDATIQRHRTLRLTTFTGFETIALMVLFAAAVMRLAGDTYNPFIYFRF